MLLLLLSLLGETQKVKIKVIDKRAKIWQKKNPKKTMKP